MKQDDQQERDNHIDIDLAREMGRVCVCFNLRKATRYVTQFYDKELRSTGLRVTQLTLLTAIRVMGPTNLKRLSEAVGMDQTTLSRNVGLLQKKGLVEMEPGSDLRTRKISLTPRGHEGLNQAYPLWKAAQAEIVSKIGSDNWISVLESVGSIRRK
ncbi:MAG: MarR family winged helix-turn-helix transcriptional regulator [Desulfomonilaceae bacterium]|jgi:DNA-binding MarR family transcriptional regulator